jgi:hypothetical protein
MDELPDEILLNPSRTKWVLVLLIGVLFSAGGGFMIADGETANGLFCLLFFGLCALVALKMLSSSSSQMKLDRSGFVERTLFGHTNAQRWVDVSEFSVFDSGVSNAMVVYEPRVVEGGSAKQAFANVSRALTGGKAHGISDTYGMSAEELADLMNAFRTRALMSVGPAQNSRLSE